MGRRATGGLSGGGSTDFASEMFHGEGAALEGWLCALLNALMLHLAQVHLLVLSSCLYPTKTFIDNLFRPDVFIMIII